MLLRGGEGGLGLGLEAGWALGEGEGRLMVIGGRRGLLLIRMLRLRISMGKWRLGFGVVGGVH